MLYLNTYNFGLMALLFMTLTGCATYRTSAVRPNPRLLGVEFETFQAPERAPEEDTSLVNHVEQAGDMTLERALSLALLWNPKLATFSYEIQAAEKRAIQAGLYPNPEVEAELENIGGSGELRGFNGTETTISISQPLLLAGKRQKAMRVAALEGDLAAWDYESRRLDVITEVRKVFTRVLATQQIVELNTELVDLSEQLVESIHERLKAGKVSPAELSRAQVRLSASRVELNRARRELEAARQKLASTWGSRTAEFDKTVGRLDTLISIPPLEKLKPLLSQNPDLARFDKEVEQRQAVVALEDAKRIPDPALSGGYRRLNESDDHSFVLAIAVPLPLTDRNQGARQEARIELARTAREREAVEVQLNAKLIQARNQFQNAYTEAIALRDEIIVEARNAYNIIREGYRMGRFDFLDVLDAQQTLFEARRQYLRTLMEYHQSVAEVERIVAQGIDTVQ